MRHGPACPGHPRVFLFEAAKTKKNVDGPDKPGHDEEE
jgi:hypothetical protein